ncbi:MAG: hypothetical protein JWN56_2352 [Sphingobacteriales bacterium]|nr:hypothetical protein [Sphingobacteriales bacterium]
MKSSIYTPMKKLSNNASPFLMLLIPLFIVVGLLIMNVNNEIPAENYHAGLNLQVPSLKELIQSIF